LLLLLLLLPRGVRVGRRGPGGAERRGGAAHALLPLKLHLLPLQLLGLLKNISLLYGVSQCNVSLIKLIVRG
jgi:hypothetical protein